MVVNRKMEISRYQLLENIRKVATVRSQCVWKGTVNAFRLMSDVVMNADVKDVKMLLVKKKVKMIINVFTHK